MTDDEQPKTAPSREGRRAIRPRRLAAIAALVAACAVGAGAAELARKGDATAVVTLAPSAIDALQPGARAAIEGQVAEIFGNKFVVQDASGRALVETGRAGEGGTLVAKAEVVTVQGRFEHGFVHAVAIRHADGRTDRVGPPPPAPPPGPGAGPAAR